MTNQSDLGEVYTTNNEFTANVTITIGNTTVNVTANSTIFRIRNATHNSTINATNFPGTTNNTLYVGSVTSDNVVSNAQLQANLASHGGVATVPSGTKMIFMQTSSPIGWTKDTTHNNKTLRVVSGTASSGGSVAFSTLFGRTSTDNFTITSTYMPSLTLSESLTGSSHNHSYTVKSEFGTNQSGSSSAIWRHSQTLTTEYTQPSVSGSITYGGGGSGHSHGLDMRVQYVDVIFCTKN